MAMSGGSLRRRSVGGACDHEDQPGRVSSPSGPSLGERTPPYGILHTAMVLNRRKDVIGQAVRNSERFAKQKDKQQGRATAMHSKESEKSVSAARSQVHL